MSNLVIILGESGSGKSTSIRTLNPDETLILNTLGKRLPFPKSKSMYSKEKGNLINIVADCNEYNEANKGKSIPIDYCSYTISALKAFGNKPDSKLKNIIIDDGIYTMRTEFFKRTKETGYGKFNEIGNHFRLLIETCLSLKEDLNIFLMLHSEPVESDGRIIKYKAATIGKLFEEKYGTNETVTELFYAKPQFDDKGKPNYGFYTHTVVVDGIEIPAKTSMGLFEEDYIPNDLNLIVKKMEEYY